MSSYTAFGWENGTRVPVGYAPDMETAAIDEDHDPAALVRRVVGGLLSDRNPALQSAVLARAVGFRFAGDSVEAMAARFGCSVSSIHERRRKIATTYGIHRSGPATSLSLVLVRRIVGIVLADHRPSLGIECIALATGLCYDGHSMESIAKRHGVTRAAVSKRCVEITSALGLKPGRAMRQLGNREVCRRSRLLALCSL